MTGTRECPICGVFRSKSNQLFYDPCTVSYDRSTAKDDGTLWAALAWAAKRGRRFERARLTKTQIEEEEETY